jgi:hypothetical protein
MMSESTENLTQGDTARSIIFYALITITLIIIALMTTIIIHTINW